MSDETFDFESLIEEAPVTADIGFERKLCMNAIMDKTFMRGVKSLLTDITLLESPLARSIMSWCIEYFNEYGKEMRHTIIGVYEQKRIKLSETISKDINDFLESISEQYAQSDKIFNPEFELDIAETYIKTRKVKKLQEKLDKYMLTGNTTKANQMIANFTQVKMSQSDAVDIQKDFSRYERQETGEGILMHFPGKFGEMIGPIKRKEFMAFAGGSKSGKSRMLLNAVVEAYRQGLAVLFCSLEMERYEVEKLLDDELLRMSLEDGTAYIPIFKGTGAGTVITHKKMERQASTPEEMKAKHKSLQQFNPHGRIYVRCWAQDEMTIEDHLKPELDSIRAKDALSFDLIISDYADIAAPPAGYEKKERRHQLDAIWKEHKRLAQDYNCFVLTGSQADEKTLDMREDYRKKTHVNAQIGIKSSPEDKMVGISRYYLMAHRSQPFNPDRALIVLTNHGVGLAHLDSRWESEEWDATVDVDENFKLWTPTKGKHDNEVDLYDLI